MSTQFINRWFNFAKKHLDKCDHHTHNIVAVVVINKTLVSVGWNNINKTHPDMFRHSVHKKKHAEVMALNLAKHRYQDLSEAKLIVYGQTKAGNQICSKPCKYCQKIIKEYGVKEVIYSSHNSFETYYEENIA